MRRGETDRKAYWLVEKERTIIMNATDVLAYIESCGEEDDIDENSTCYCNIISRTYKFTTGKSLAIAGEWGRNFGKDAYWRSDGLPQCMDVLLGECKEACPLKNGYRYGLKKSQARGKLTSIGF